MTKYYLWVSSETLEFAITRDTVRTSYTFRPGGYLYPVPGDLAEHDQVAKAIAQGDLVYSEEGTLELLELDKNAEVC